MRCRDARGLTIIEVLTVIGIIGLLAAITLPAVMATRERSRRTTCVSRLAQLGKALHQFEAAHGSFPAGAGSFPKKDASSPQFWLLPFLERPDLVALAKRWNVDASGTLLLSTKYPNQFGTQRVEPFICPADERELMNLGISSYRVCVGSGPGSHSLFTDVPSLQGAFNGQRRRGASEIHDGLSQTAAMSEKLMGGGSPDTFDPKRDVRFTGLSITGGLKSMDKWTPDEWLSICAKFPPTAERFYPYMGGSWSTGSHLMTWYNHVAPPNSPIADAEGQLMERQEDTETFWVFVHWGGSYRASSLHGGGVNCLFMDGRVDFVADSIALSVWRAMGTAAGNEPL